MSADVVKLHSDNIDTVEELFKQAIEKGAKKAIIIFVDDDDAPALGYTSNVNAGDSCYMSALLQAHVLQMLVT